MAFSLPPNVTVRRTALSGARFQYIFVHSMLGVIGTLEIQPTKDGVVATPSVREVKDDPRNADRATAFEPLAEALTAHLSATVLTLR